MAPAGRRALFPPFADTFAGFHAPALSQRKRVIRSVCGGVGLFLGGHWPACRVRKRVEVIEDKAFARTIIICGHQ